MPRPSVLLPWITTALPFIAGTLPFFHGTFAGLIATASPLVVDIALRGDVRFDAKAPRESLPTRYYDVLFWLYAVGFLFFFTRFAFTCGSLDMIDAVGQGFSWVVLSGIPTLIVGHAFIHGRSRSGRIVGQALFSLMNYPDFPMLHIEGHHRHVATIADVHSAPKNETFYRFFVRYMSGELRSLPRAPRRRRIVGLAVVQLVLLAAVGWRGGFRGLFIFLTVTALARGVVALVNYVQHYGLERSANQKPNTDHAWDLPFKSGNWLYFNAGFHADHHMKASIGPADLAFRATRYALPYNIQVILPLALVPPLFFRTMNPILESTSVSPSNREPRHGTPAATRMSHA